MWAWIIANLATILISLSIVGIVAGIVISIVRDKKAGNSSCGCGCEHCAMKDSCHKK